MNFLFFSFFSGSKNRNNFLENEAAAIDTLWEIGYFGWIEKWEGEKNFRFFEKNFFLYGCIFFWSIEDRNDEPVLFRKNLEIKFQ